MKVRVPERFHAALKNCADNWTICMDPLDGAKEFCEYCKAKGYGLYVLSNASDEFYKYFPKFLPLDFFDGVFVSADYLMLKPDLEIYRKFLDTYGLVGSECLFIDDREANVSAAIESGINAVRFNGDFEEIIRLLK